MDKFILVELHRGSTFESGQLLHYSGGQINYCYYVDPDLMSYFESMGMVSELGYNNISELHYRNIPCRGFETGLWWIVSDKEILERLDNAKMTSSIEVYVEHLDAENVGLEDNQGVVETSDSDRGYEEIDGRRNKPRFPVFNRKNYMSKIEPLCGMKFANPNKLKECLTSYVVSKGYQQSTCNMCRWMPLEMLCYLYVN